jgi:hypothetical protein
MAEKRFELWRVDRAVASGLGGPTFRLVGRFPTLAAATVGAYAFGPGKYRISEAGGNVASVRIAKRKAGARCA